MRRKKKKKKKGARSLRNASPAEVASAFAGEVQLLSEEAAASFDGEILPSELRSLDEALGVGGFPKGRVVEIFGPESAGKTALALHMIAKAQQAGGKGAIIDVEHALQLAHARQLGVDVPTLMISQPDSGEKAMSLTLRMVKSHAADVVVVDSVALLQPLNEQEKGIDHPTMGGASVLMSRSMRFLKRAALRSGVLLIFINQIRFKMNVRFGNPETTPGGQALRFGADIRIRIQSEGEHKRKGRTIGQNSKLRIVKNKIGMPFQNARLRLVYGKGWRSLKNKDKNDD